MRDPAWPRKNRGRGSLRKSEMGNVGGHFMDNNVLVYVQGDVGTPIVFELARNGPKGGGEVGGAAPQGS